MYLKIKELNEDLKIVYLGDYEDISTADIDNDDSEQIVIVDHEDLLMWKNDLEKIKEAEKNEDFFLFKIDTGSLKFELVYPEATEDTYDELFDEIEEAFWIFRGENSLNELYSQVIKNLKD